MEELVKNNVTLWALGLIITGFLSGIGAYKLILEIANLKVISLNQWDSIQSLLGSSKSVNQIELAKNEKVVLFELVTESKGIGDSVAVYPFESNFRKLGIKEDDATLTIASLQERGFVSLGKEEGYDDLHNRKSFYPVYRVTKDGFKWALQHTS